MFPPFARDFPQKSGSTQRAQKFNCRYGPQGALFEKIPIPFHYGRESVNGNRMHTCALLAPLILYLLRKIFFGLIILYRSIIPYFIQMYVMVCFAVIVKIRCL